MNPVSHDLKRQDYLNLWNAIKATGNESSYFEMDGNLVDAWCVNMRYDEIESIFIRGYGYVYKDGNKYKP